MGPVLSVASAIPVIGGLFQAFTKPATKPVDVTEAAKEAGKSPEQMKKEAQEALGIDCINNYNFGLCGNSGVGKSSLINALLQENVAETGEVECTAVAKGYRSPKAPHLVLWDLPGGETKKHPGESYFMDQKIYAFDAVIIAYSERVTALALCIAESCDRFRVPYCFVRTKADVALEAVARKQPSRLPKKQWHTLLPKLKATIAGDLHEQVMRQNERLNCKLFMVSAWNMADAEAEEDLIFDEIEFMEWVHRCAQRRAG